MIKIPFFSEKIENKINYTPIKNSRLPEVSPEKPNDQKLSFVVIVLFLIGIFLLFLIINYQISQQESKITLMENSLLSPTPTEATLVPTADEPTISASPTHSTIKPTPPVTLTSFVAATESGIFSVTPTPSPIIFSSNDQSNLFDQSTQAANFNPLRENLTASPTKITQLPISGTIDKNLVFIILGLSIILISLVI